MPREVVQHFALPFRRMENLRPALLEQDTQDDVVQCIQVILDTPLGFRELSPNFGLRDYTFAAGGIDTEKVYVAIQQSEPRAEPLLSRYIDDIDELFEHLQVGIGDVE